MVLSPSRPELEPLAAEELDAVPMFPLPRVVLLPGGMLPLHVFEPRYRAMMEDCIERGPRVIAMAMLRSGWESAHQGRPAVHEIAGIGRIVAHRKNPDGTYDLVLEGVARARLEERTELDRSYRVAQATVLEDEENDAPALRRAMEPVLATSSSLAALELVSGRAPARPTDLSGTPGRVIDRLADRWLHEAATRQRVLETTGVTRRIALVGEALVTLLARLSTPSTSGGSIPPPN